MSFMASELVQQINPGPASCKKVRTHKVKGAVTNSSNLDGALAVQICEFANYFFDEVEYLYR